MRFAVALLFWAGVFMAMREWLYSRKHRIPITRSEKLYPAIAFMLVAIALPLIGIAPQTSGFVLGVILAVILNVWAVRRRMRRVGL